MTAAILSFPTLLERDEAEFDRKGTSNYTRAVGEAAALWDAAMQGRAGWACRIEALATRLEHLARYRPERLDDMVSLANGGSLELRLVPKALRSMLRRAAND